MAVGVLECELVPGASILAVNIPLDVPSHDSLNLLISALSDNRLNWKPACAPHDAITAETIRRPRVAADQDAKQPELGCE